MAATSIIQNMIRQLGQSQGDRTSRELGVHFADVDERTAEQLLLFTKKFSKTVNYYRNGTSAKAGDWSPFFVYDESTVKTLLESHSGSTTPHLALFLSFLRLYQQPQTILNRITGRHLDFYFHDVLRLRKKGAIPDKAHVLLELKKQSSPISIVPENVFSAGKDGSGVELIYKPTTETVINTSTVTSLRSVFRDDTGHGTVRYAPVANSSDGLGGELPEEEPKWYGFGHAGLPEAEVGFALASPVLRMQEGTRNVAVKLTLGNVAGKLDEAALEGAFSVFVSGEKSWLGPYSVSPTLEGDVMEFGFSVPETETAVINYDPAIHGYAYTTDAPILQVMLKAGGVNVGYNDFRGIIVKSARISVDVSGVTSLSLESDSGTLDPKKAFTPFGAHAAKGSRFMVGCDEALSKRLSELRIKVQWKDAPSNFATHYANYGESGVSNSDFKATASFEDAGTWKNHSSGVGLFQSNDASSERTFTFAPGSSSVAPGISTGMRLYALSASGSLWGSTAARALSLKNPVFSSFQRVAPEPRVGFITFWLERGFLHDRYRREYVRHVMNFSKGLTSTLVILNEPYTPTIQGIELSYKAHSEEANLASSEADDFSNLDVQFFHIAYFGQMREHAYQRAQFSFLADKGVSLLPAYESQGELLIGLSDLRGGDSVSVLFQVAEGSSDPDFKQEQITWSVLCDNYWRTLGPDGVVLDTTNQLLRSGLIKFVIPAEATTRNTILQGGLLWLRAGVSANVTAVCQLLEVAANGVEVQFADAGSATRHLTAALESGRIAKLKNGLSALKSVRQPYASFDGGPEETDEAFHRRVSERLRHKDRCVASWDYERIILEEFPKVHRVKCIPHAKEGSWLAPGHVLIVVVPDLKNKNARDPLQPKVDAETISRIADFVQARAGMQVRVKVKNPTYQRIQLDFKVQFHQGYEFNRYSEQLKQKLIAFLSPWTVEPGRELTFGGRIYKSVLVDFVEELKFVDYVRDFKMYSYTTEPGKVDVNEAQPEVPDAILVSDYTHNINAVD